MTSRHNCGEPPFPIYHRMIISHKSQAKQNCTKVVQYDTTSLCK